MIDGVDIDGPTAPPRRNGELVFDACAIAPRAIDPHYREWLAAYVDRHRIDCVIPTSEAEISNIIAGDLPAAVDARFMISNARTVEVGIEKRQALLRLSALLDRCRTRKEQYLLRDLRGRDPDLLAGNDVVPALAVGARLDSRGVEPGVRLRDREAGALLAGDQAGTGNTDQQTCLL